MKPNMRVTQRATEHLKQILAERAKEPDQCLRIVRVPLGAAVAVDRVHEEDTTVVEVDGKPILTVEPALVTILRATTLDYRDSETGARLTLVR